MPYKDIKRAISLEMNKLDIDAFIHWTYINSLKEELSKRDRNRYTLEVLLPVKEKIKKVVKERIRVCGSSEKA